MKKENMVSNQKETTPTVDKAAQASDYIYGVFECEKVCNMSTLQIVNRLNASPLIMANMVGTEFNTSSLIGQPIVWVIPPDDPYDWERINFNSTDAINLAIEIRKYSRFFANEYRIIVVTLL
jgi:hypothetical protein